MSQEWVKPQLRVLIKGKPEEQVLQMCKYDQQNLAGYAGIANGCASGVVNKGPTNPGGNPAYCYGAGFS